MFVVYFATVKFLNKNPQKIPNKVLTLESNNKIDTY